MVATYLLQNFDNILVNTLALPVPVFDPKIRGQHEKDAELTLGIFGDQSETCIFEMHLSSSRIVHLHFTFYFAFFLNEPSNVP